jgi:hypothetical protein
VLKYSPHISKHQYHSPRYYTPISLTRYYTPISLTLYYTPISPPHTGDIDGWDAAVKVAALATVLMGVKVDVAQVRLVDV